MITLAIETSCDETAVCLLETRGSTYRVLGSIIHSQVDLHKEYGGVFPMLAKREHAKNLVPLLEQLITESGITQEKLGEIDTDNITSILSKEQDLGTLLFASSLVQKKPLIDRIVVTQGPGLEPALWVGISFAKALHKLWNIPLIPINHMEGHVVSSCVQHSHTENDFVPFTLPKLPLLALLISGGHTEIVYTTDLNIYELVGKTRDDAVGEAFDKVARMLNLPYPGGPQVSRLAEIAREQNIPSPVVLPRPMLHSPDMNFSFSGLKTSVLYTLKERGEVDEETLQGLCREFEDAVTEVICTKVKKALEKYTPESLVVGGGVIANLHIREALIKLTSEHGIPLHIPHQSLTGDNALMIAIAGSQKSLPVEHGDMRALGNLTLWK